MAAKKKQPQAVSFSAQSINAVSNHTLEDLGRIIEEDGMVFFDPYGGSITADELVAIAAKMYEKEKEQ